jgi:uncharacterized membrane protein
MKKQKRSVLFLAQGALIAAMYVALTMLSSAFGLASGVIQVRISEALTILPYFTPAAIPGLFVGCLVSNILAGGVIWDVIFGSLATLIGAVITYALRKCKWLAPVPPIVSNMLIVPFVLRYAYGAPDAIWFMMLTVGAGELISAGVLGMLLLLALDKRRNAIFNKKMQ